MNEQRANVIAENQEDEGESKTARLIYNEELQRFYDDIQITTPTRKTHIFHLAKPPIDIDKLNKSFVKNSGIDPSEYHYSSKFNISHDIFYKLLFSYRKSDQPDANL